MLGAFVKHFPQPLNPAMEARNQLSMMAAKAGDTGGVMFGSEIVAAIAARARRTDRRPGLARRRR